MARVRQELAPGTAVPCPTKKKRIATLCASGSFGIVLAEDVFYFVEEAGGALGGLVLNLHGLPELVEQLALLAGELGREHHTNIHVEVAAASVRVGQPLALDAENLPRLSSFGDLQVVLALERGDRIFAPSAACGMLTGTVQ